MATLGVVNRWLLIRRHFRVANVDLPQADRECRQRAGNESTAALLAPNHPEFGVDWMMDKELSTLAAPWMASWAAHEIIATAPWFWRRNNLVANNGGADAVRYSMKSAMRGRGVLLHPEGMVHWTGDRVHPLFPGVAEMAVDTANEVHARGDTRRTFIVPMVWKLRYVEDVSTAIHREMTCIERELSLPNGRGLRVVDRFAELQHNILARQMARFGFDARGVKGLDLFNQQSAFRAWLVAQLQARYRVQLADSMERTIHRLRRAIATSSDANTKADLARAGEAARRGGFTRDVYASPMLTQEQIFESLKRHRATLMRSGLANTMHNFLPTPYGSRVAHVRVPEPIRVEAGRTDHDAYVGELLRETRGRMQAALDAINIEIAPKVAAFSHANPFAALDAARAA